MKPGIYDNLTNKDYHATEAFSSSKVKEIEISPAHYIDSKTRAFDPELSVESLVHLFLLEPEAFNSGEYFQFKAKRSKEEKRLYQEAIDDGKMVARESDVEKAQEVAANIFKNERLKTILTSGQNEHSVFVEQDGVELKIRPDVLNIKDKKIYDVKTITRGMSKFQLESLVRTRGWDIQAAFYLNVIKEHTGEDFEFLNIARGDGDLRYLVSTKSSLGGDAERLLREHHDAGFCWLCP